MRPAAAVLTALGLVLSGCETTVAVTPKLPDPPGEATRRIHAPLRYQGKPDYLPQALIADDRAGSIAIRYEYTAQYGFTQAATAVTFVNPLTLFGFPTDSNSLVVAGRVDVLRDDAPIRSYGAAVSMKRAGSIFSEGETFTEMRRRGLLLVRDNLNRQICGDEANLVPLLTPSPSATALH